MRRGGRARAPTWESVGRNIVETIVGALVLVVAGVFVFYAFAKSDRSGPAGYEIIARFDRIDGLKRGADVTLSGVKVGTVTGFDLDRKTYQAVVRMMASSECQPAGRYQRQDRERIAAGRHGRRAGARRRHARCCRRAARSQMTQGAIPLSELIAKFMFGGTSSGSQVMRRTHVPRRRPVWRQPDGKPVSCLEKIKVLNQNIQEIETLCADALEDGVLMGCDADQIKAALHELIDGLKAPHTAKK